MRHEALQLCSLPCLLLLQAPPGEADGLLLSPFSLAKALAMLANGAEPGGESYKQVLVGSREGPRALAHALAASGSALSVACCFYICSTPPMIERHAPCCT